MTLPVSGPISFNAINVELGQAGTTTASLGQASYRALAGVASGAISLSNFYGKSSVTYKGYPVNLTTLNDWYLVAGLAVYGNANAENNNYSAFGFQTNGGTRSTAGTQRWGYVVASKATSTPVAGYVFNALASGNTPIDGYYLSVPDPWGNLYLQVGTSGASQPNARFCRITSSSNYSAIGNQWQYYGSSGISISNQSIIVNGSYFFINFTGGYLLRIDSSGGVTAFNNSASSGGTPPENQVARGGNSSNQFVISMNPSSSLASWGAWACFNYFDSSGSLLNQYLFNNTGDATNSGRGVTNIQYGPVSNFISFLWSGRFGGTSTSFARNGTAWWSATNSSSAPSLLKATRGNTQAESLSSDYGYLLLAVDGAYEYWGNSLYFYKINSSGLVLQGWYSPNSYASFPVNKNGTISITSATANNYTGITTISRLLSNQVSGANFTDYPNKNGTYIYNQTAY